MRTLQSEMKRLKLDKNGQKRNKQSKNKYKNDKNKKNEEKLNFVELMGMNRPRYGRRRGAWRQK